MEGAAGDAPAAPRSFVDRDLHPDVDRWHRLFSRLGIAPNIIFELSLRATANGSSIIGELTAAGLVDDGALHAAIAAEFGLGYLAEVDAETLLAGPQDALALIRAQPGRRLVQALGEDGSPIYLFGPEGPAFADTLATISASPEISRRTLIVSPKKLRQALIARAEPEARERARDALFLRTPHLSARMVANAWQGAMAGTLAVCLPMGFLFWPGTALAVLHVALSGFFFACVALRVAAALGGHTPRPPPRPPPDAASLPTYSVVVALMNEAEVVPDLLVALGRLSWPRSKLEIKIVCEHDDRTTLSALRALNLRPWVEVVVVPPGMPRSKPNALTYALPFTTGAIVAVYDAEDRPHPMQLIEAWQALDAGGPRLACVQAPIDVENGDAGILPRMFEVEYAALFHGLLPYLADRDVMLPLGGTSNHFRRAALEQVAAWDPYNMTEDADLGARLARLGYRTDVVTLPTGEDGPDTAMVWLRQRTRWFKGWSQTWLVHMRNPRRLAREIGLPSFLMVQVLFAGMLVSALSHPVMAGLVVWVAAQFLVQGSVGGFLGALFWFDASNIVLGYGAFLALAWRSLPRKRRHGFWKVVAFTPAYWMMLSAAAWRALYQLCRAPHVWEKTPHKRRWTAALPSLTPRRRDAGRPALPR